MIRLSKIADNIGGQPMFKLLAKANQMEAEGKKILHFEIGDSCFSTPQHITQSAVDSLKKGETHYTSSMGIPELRKTICQITKRDYGFQPDLGQVVVTPSANAIVYFVIRCVVNPGEEVIVPDPGFPTYSSAINLIGVKPIPVPLHEANNFRMNPEDVKSRVTKNTRLIIINSPSNPTGSVMNEDEIKEIFRIAEKNDLFILSDEVYAKMTYDKQHYSTAMQDKCRERTIILNGFSKVYAMSGYRLGYAIGPEQVADRIGLMVQTINSCVSPFVQKAGIKALLDGEDSIKTMMLEYRKRRDLIVKGLNSLPGVSCQTPQGAIYVFPNISKTGLTDVEFADLMLKEAGVALLPGSNFGKYGNENVRLCFTGSLEDIEEGIDKMKRVLLKRLNKIEVQIKK